MKHYNIQNYIRYKKDVEATIKRIPKKEFCEYTRDELIITFLPLVENLARKLDIVCSDLQEVQFRLGLDRGCEIGSATISELVEMKENYKFGGDK